jgi:hypothetical protein
VSTTVLVGLVAVVAVGAAGIAGAVGEIYRPRDGGMPAASTRPVQSAAHDPRKPTVAIVVGPKGANVADTRAPCEVLASTGAFNVYIVAAQRQPVR